MKELITSYFHTLFTTVDTGGRMDLLESVQDRVTDAINQELAKDYLATDVSLALQQMHSVEVQSSDGMPPIFFQKHWQIMDSSVIKTVLKS